MIFKIILAIDWDISHEISSRWMYFDLTDDKSTLFQVMAWCSQATSHYLSQCCPDLCRHMASLDHNEVKENKVQHVTVVREEHNFNPLHVKFIFGNLKMYLIFHHFSVLRWCSYFISLIVEEKQIFILHIQHCGCWCPGEARSQGINCNNI